MLPIEQLHTVRDYLRWAVSRFTQAKLWFGHGTDNATDEALTLICHALHLPWEQASGLLDARLVLEEKQTVIDLIERRVTERKPSAYLTGEAWFAGLKFTVDERVLVPRSPVAELIEAEFQPWLGDTQVYRVLDLCTGSGCIGIAAAMVFDEAEVDLVDISKDALDVANANIERHGLQRRVRTVHSDLFESLGNVRYDLIISNPPYVDADDLDAMPAEYHQEPALGLASGDDGLDCARDILLLAPDYLQQEGLLVLEVGNSGEALQEQYPEVPFTWVEFERGGHGVLVINAQDLAEYAHLFEID